MTSLYLARTTGTGTGEDPFRPGIPDGRSFVCLMIDPATGRALLVSSSDTISTTGTVNLLTAATPRALLELARTTSPSSQRRTALQNWLSNAGYPPVPAQATSWVDVVRHVARTVNPDGDLERVDLA